MRMTLALSGEGSLVASGSVDCTVKLWDVTTSIKAKRIEENKSGIANGLRLLKTVPPKSTWVYTLRFSPKEFFCLLLESSQKSVRGSACFYSYKEQLKKIVQVAHLTRALLELSKVGSCYPSGVKASKAREKALTKDLISVSIETLIYGHPPVLS